ncbi:MAG: tetratricopeptide repeat protein, partial [Desulfobacterales bacterium]|nr:tetratricopeptide repeat protein [Desulfobacterales bacterium]
MSLESLRWAVTSTYATNWHPMTWLSHILDVQLYGMAPGSHHLTNVLFHVANALMLFLVFRRMTDGLWRSAFVAALFALHPLHVESVAWVAERKDVLSTFFWLLTMWCYARYAERPGTKRYIPVVLFFILGLMSKPMLVTLPFILLLMDYWPLKRFQSGQSGVRNLVFEKVPLFALSAAASAVTFFAQHSGGAVKPIYVYPLTDRVANAFISYMAYLGKMIWPCHLAVLYPYPQFFPWWQTAGAFLFLVSVSVLVIRTVGKRPYLAAGWLWYIGTLIPVIGLVQVGEQAMADRYTYIPLIGIFIMIAWGTPDLLSKWRHKKAGLAVLGTIVLLIMTVVTHFQLRYWTNSITLFEHAIHVTSNNYIMCTNLGSHLLHQGKLSEATKLYNKAVQIKPDYMCSRFNLGAALAMQGKYAEAIRHYNEALRINPGFAGAHYNMAAALKNQGNVDEAINHLSEAVRLNPRYAERRSNLGNDLAKHSKADETISHFSDASGIVSDSAKAHFMLGNVLLGNGKTREAVIRFQEALRIENNFAEAHTNLGYALHTQGKDKEAVKHCLEAIRLKPDTSIDAYYNLACIYAVNNKTEESIDWLKKAIDKGFNNRELLRTDN